MSPWFLIGCVTADPIDSDPVLVPDSDGDGWADEDDCGPDDPVVHPEAAERCNGIDDDCDGEAEPTYERFVDLDGDGTGSTTESTCEPGDPTPGGDCNDANAAVFPGAPEVCNGGDDDCDQMVDEEAIDATLVYEDADGDGTGAGTGSITCDPGSATTVGGDCDDLDPTRSPLLPDLCGDRIDNDCDLAVDGDCWAGTRSLAEAAVIFEAEDVGQTPGRAMAAADLDLDGDDEVLVSAFLPSEYGSGWHHGVVYVVDDPLAGTTNLATLPTTWSANSGNEDFGTAVSTAFDGEATWVVASDADLSLVYAMQAPWEGTLTTEEADRRIGGDNDHRVGITLSTGDLDGDGADEIVAGDKVGAVSIWPLEGSGSTPTAGTVAPGGVPDVAMDGDVDGDGVDDLLVGAAYSPAGPGGGETAVFQGPLSSEVAWNDADVRVAGSVMGEAFAYAVAYTGDFDGDGRDDWIAGAPGWTDGSHLGPGRAVVVPGALTDWGAANDVALLAITGTVDFELVGISVSGAGDLNGDGYAEALVGADGYTDALVWTGGALVLQGGTTGVLDANDSAAALVGEATNDFAGETVAAAGDTDGDGLGEVLVSAPQAHDFLGAVYLVRP